MSNEEKSTLKKKKKREKAGKDETEEKERRQKKGSPDGTARNDINKEKATAPLGTNGKEETAPKVLLADAENRLASKKKKRKRMVQEGGEPQTTAPKKEDFPPDGRLKVQAPDGAEPAEPKEKHKRKAAPNGVDPPSKKEERNKGSKEGLEETSPSKKKSKKDRGTPSQGALNSSTQHPVQEKQAASKSEHRKSKKDKSRRTTDSSAQEPEHERRAADEDEHKGSSAGDLLASKRKKRRKTGTVDQGESLAEAAGPSSVINLGGHERSLLNKERAESWKKDNQRTGLKYGNFTKEEDAILRAAIAEYIEGRNLGEDAVEKLLNTRKHKEVLGAWLEIGRCLPDRSIKRVHARASRLLHEGNYKGKWSIEEEERLQVLYGQFGPEWAKIGERLGRLPDACKDKWRLLKVVNKRKGAWSQQEKDTLCRLVRENLSQREDDDLIDGRIVRDNINWMAISEKMGGRDYNQCLLQWYQVLAPDRVRTRVESSDWSHDDDQLMLQRIVESGAASEPDVEWNDLLPGKDGSLCRKRWRMMVKHLPPLQEFEGKLKMLCERYANLSSGAVSSGQG